MVKVETGVIGVTLGFKSTANYGDHVCSNRDSGVCSRNNTWLLCFRACSDGS